MAILGHHPQTVILSIPPSEQCISPMRLPIPYQTQAPVSVGALSPSATKHYTNSLTSSILRP